MFVDEISLKFNVCNLAAILSSSGGTSWIKTWQVSHTLSVEQVFFNEYSSIDQ